MNRSRVRLFLAAGFLAGCGTSFADAQVWPEKPITIVVGHPQSFGVDTVARLLQGSLERHLRTPISFDHMVGDEGNVAIEYVAKARPDGYTLLLGTSAAHVLRAANRKKSAVDIQSDFTPITTLNEVSRALIVNPEIIDVNSVADFDSKVRANPAKFKYASAGDGTLTHLTFSQFVRQSGLKMVHMPYESPVGALKAVIAGEACCMIHEVQAILSEQRTGKVRMLGVSTLQPRSMASDVPAIDSVPILPVVRYWVGLFAPKALDPVLADRINLAVKKALETPGMDRKIVSLGYTSRYETIDQFNSTLRQDRAIWDEMKAGIEADGGASLPQQQQSVAKEELPLKASPGVNRTRARQNKQQPQSDWRSEALQR